MKDLTNNPQRLACHECDAAIDLYHFPQCFRSGTVMGRHCIYKYEYKLPHEFLAHGIREYGRLREVYFDAKYLISDLENLCEAHNITLPQ